VKLKLAAWALVVLIPPKNKTETAISNFKPAILKTDIFSKSSPKCDKSLKSSLLPSTLSKGKKVLEYKIFY
jgi:hypothetical protein